MTEVFFAYTNDDDIRDELLHLEDDVLFDDDTCVIGCDKSRFAKDDTAVVAMFGEIFNIDEYGYDISKYTDAEIVLKLLESEDLEDIISGFTGCFTIFVYEREWKQWTLITDVMGMYYPFYYAEEDEFLISMNLNDFSNDLFDFDPLGMEAIIKEKRINKTPVDGVYTLSAGSMIIWPECQTSQYIDISDDLNHAYNNKIDIDVAGAISHIDSMLRKTVNVTSRHYDKDRIGVEFTYNIDGILAASTVKACGIDPVGYSSIFPLQESLPTITKKEVTNETTNRRKATERLNDKLGLVDILHSVKCDYKKIGQQMASKTITNPGTTRWAKALHNNAAKGEIFAEHGRSCVYNGELGDSIFLNRLQHHILYTICADDSIEDLSEENIANIFHDVIHDSSLYFFGAPPTIGDISALTSNGFVDYIVNHMNKFKALSSERDSRVEWNIPRIGIYKDYRLWTYILSLPTEVMLEVIPDAKLHKGIIENQCDVKPIKWTPMLWRSWNYRESVIFNKKTDDFPRSAPIMIPNTDQLDKDWDDAISLLLDKEVDLNTVWEYKHGREINPGALSIRSMKLLLVYYWLKEWLK